MMQILSVVLLVCLSSLSINAFVPIHPFKLAHSPLTTSSLSLMTTKEIDTLLQQANSVVQSKECSQAEVDELIEMLHVQRRELNTRIQTLSKTLNRLEAISNSDERKVDEVRETIRAIYRVFQLSDKASGNDYPALSKPTGWSGEIGDGPTTAYDALPPKKYKP